MKYGVAEDGGQVLSRETADRFSDQTQTAWGLYAWGYYSLRKLKEEKGQL